MAYQIDRYNGTFLVSVDDQTVDSTTTDLRFVGRNYSGYGEIENENFLHLLENFANSTSPPKAISGQLWYDTSTKKLKLFDGTIFKVVSGAESSATAPVGLAAGDFWYDNQNQQIFVWTGANFTLVGPEKTPVYGQTSAAPAAVKSVDGSTYNIVKLQVDGQTIAIVSNSNFTLSNLANPIDGFDTIQKGINFLNSNATTGVTSSEYRFWGTAANAERLGGLTVDKFLRADTASFGQQVSFKDAGLVIGDGADMRLRILDGSTPLIESYFNQPIILRISNDGGNIKDVAVVRTTGIEPGLTTTYDLGSVAAKWKTVNAESVKATTFYGKLIGEVESTNTGVPLNFNSVVISGAFNHTSASDNFNITLSGTASATLVSGAVGSINNFNIGTTTRGTAAFTSLTASSPVTFTNTTAASSTTTGALVVTGGAGISGPIYVGGDSRFTSTGGIGIPAGTTAQRPGIPPVGMIRYNTTIAEWEGWDGSEWRLIGGDADEDYGLITSSVDSFTDYGGIL